MTGRVEITAVDHVGIRVADAARAIAFYEKLGFAVRHRVAFDAVTILRNNAGVEINLIHNANDANGGRNVLMDMPVKYAGYTHVAFRVASLPETVATLRANGIEITQGPSSFGGGRVALFVRDPDRNVIELGGHVADEAAVPGLEPYRP